MHLLAFSQATCLQTLPHIFYTSFYISLPSTCFISSGHYHLQGTSPLFSLTPTEGCWLFQLLQPRTPHPDLSTLVILFRNSSLRSCSLTCPLLIPMWQITTSLHLLKTMSYSQLVLRMAKSLEVEQPPPPKQDLMFDDINQDKTPPLSLAFVPAMLDLVKESWDKPPSFLQISR